MRAVDNHQALCTIIAQIAGRQLTHLSRTDQQYTGCRDIGKEMTGKLNSHVADRGRIAANACFAARALAYADRGAKEGREHRTAKAPSLGYLQSIHHLSLDLRFARH